MKKLLIILAVMLVSATTLTAEIVTVPMVKKTISNILKKAARGEREFYVGPVPMFISLTKKTSTNSSGFRRDGKTIANFITVYNVDNPRRLSKEVKEMIRHEPYHVRQLYNSLGASIILSEFKISLSYKIMIEFEAYMLQNHPKKVNRKSIKKRMDMLISRYSNRKGYKGTVKNKKAFRKMMISSAIIIAKRYKMYK
jgi:hypothetical protein